MPLPAHAHYRIIAFGILLAALWLSLGVKSAAADEPSVGGLPPGFDISWPQCPGHSFPPGPVGFAVIGLNAGRPYTSNECFAEQYRWASRASRNPAIYVNVDFPKPGRIEAMDGPWGRCLETDNWCRAYNWGYGIGRDAAARARASGITPGMWWLDVEFGNYWSSDAAMNSQAVRGAVDYMKEKRLPAGIYGTAYQWRVLTGGGYNPGVPIWTAGAEGLQDAMRRCTDRYAFGGGHVQMVQYETYEFDTNYICPGTELYLSQMLSTYTSGALGPASRGSSIATAAANSPSLRFWMTIPGLAN
ncbi:MAG: hypothetical protein ABIP13_12030 [Tepidiformaceae bacterium]